MSAKARLYSILICVAACALVAILPAVAAAPALGSAVRGAAGSGDGGVHADDTPQMEVVMMDVGQGDGIFIRTPSRKAYLIDAGPDARRGVIPFLRSRNVRVIDAMVLTHPHADHMGGAIEVIKTFEVREVFDSGKDNPTPEYRRLLETIRNRGIPYRQPRTGEHLDWDPKLSVMVLHPDDPNYANVNDNSIMLRITYGKVSFVFTGDAEEDAEGVVAERFGRAIQADVLKVGHHGSRTSSTPDFLDLVRPRYALISCATGNSFGHPHAQTLDHLSDVSARVLRTDIDGFLMFRSDGQTIKWSRGKLPFRGVALSSGAPEDMGSSQWSGLGRIRDGTLTLQADPGRNIWIGQATAPMWLRPLPSSPDWACEVRLTPQDGYKTEAGLALYKNPKNFVLLGIQDNKYTAMTVVHKGSMKVGSEHVIYKASRIGFRRVPGFLDALVYDESKKVWKIVWRMADKDLPTFTDKMQLGLYAKSWANRTATAVFQDFKISATAGKEEARAADE